MKTKKLSFKEIKGVLSRDEMKKIMAGSAPCTMTPCKSDSDCANCEGNTHCKRPATEYYCMA